jgi:hypothetical protein
MKTNYLLKSLAVLLLMLLVTNVTAKEINVPDGATDTDLAAALETAETGDIINILGWVTFDAPVTVNKNVHFKGGENSGFDGQGLTKILEIAPEPIDGAHLIFENLGFVGGYNVPTSAVEAPGDGGVGRIVAGTTEFIFCYFDGNYAERGGAFYMAEDNTTAYFKGCEATNNQANFRGGFIFSAGATHATYDYCRISGNSSVTERGGALYLDGAATHRFFYTLLSGNSAGIEAGEGEKGGGVLTTGGDTGGPAVTFESCTLRGNSAYQHGAVAFLMGANTNVNFINSSIVQNQSIGGAAPIVVVSNTANLTLTNVTYAANEGTNSGNGGGGIIVWSPGNPIHIFNSVLVRNICAESGEGAIDMKYNGVEHIATTVFKNSIVGLISAVDKSAVPAAQDNDAIPTKSLINMYNIAGEVAQVDYATELDQSGVDFANFQETSSFGLGYFPLKDANAYAAKLGDPALLEATGAYSDQLLVERTVAADGSIYAGAIQAVLGYDPYDDSGWESNIGVGTGIHTPSAYAKQDIRVIGTVSNGILGVDFGDWKGRAKGDLIAINGQVVEHVFDLPVVGKGYYNVNVAPGFYILKVTIEGKTFAKRLIVK